MARGLTSPATWAPRLGLTGGRMMASPSKPTAPDRKSHGLVHSSSTVTAAPSVPQPESEQPQSPTKPTASARASSTPSDLPGGQEAVAAAEGSDGGAPPEPPPELQPLQDCGRLLNRLSQSLLASMLDVPSRVQWNLLVSPISLATALASLVAGCEGPTKEDLCNLLRLTLPEVEAIVERFKIEAAEHMFYVANRMFLQSNCPLLATFRSQVEAKYMTSAQNVDFEILPTEVDGLRLTQQSLLAGDTLWEVTRLLRPRANVRLGLPMFVLKARNKMRDLLEGLGSHRPFDPEQAQFINISGFKGLHTTEIIQAVTVEVSEDGNDITRTSALVNEVVSKMAPTTQFLVDRPFLLFVRSKATGAILLFGCVRQPLEWRPDSPDNSALL
nr:uncharacterized protein LOC126531943 [Dermacentor andersoni]